MALQAADQGTAKLLLFLTMLSANLAVINFLPIPLLDGGHMVFLLYEGIRGKPADERVQVVLTYLGLILILTLMVWVLGLDFGLISRRLISRKRMPQGSPSPCGRGVGRDGSPGNECAAGRKPTMHTFSGHARPAGRSRGLHCRVAVHPPERRVEVVLDRRSILRIDGLEAGGRNLAEVDFFWRGPAA